LQHTEHDLDLDPIETEADLIAAINDDAITDEELAHWLEQRPKLHVRALNKTLDMWLIEGRLVEWSGPGTSATVHDPEEWLLDWNNELVEDFTELLERKFNEEARAYPPTLYHATDSDNVEDIMRDGLEARADTRGRTNTSVGEAVFTSDSLEEAELGHYGDAIIAINTRQMLADGLRVFFAQEPPIVEHEARGAAASALGLDIEIPFESSDGISPGTVILFVEAGVILPKYLRAKLTS
jgi:hypothetical protein